MSSTAIVNVTARDFNEWMADCIDNPEQFSRDWQDVMEALEARKNGTEPTYGERCVAYLECLQRKRRDAGSPA
jgi:hypothetical protein